MTTQYTTNKAIAYPQVNDTGWGTTVNTGLIDIDYALGGVQVMNLQGVSGTVSLVSTFTGAYPANSASYVPLTLSLSGAPLAQVTLTIPSGVGGQWIVKNACTGTYASVIVASGGGGTTTAVPGSQTRAIFSDGTNIAFADNQTAIAGSNTQVIYNNAGSLAGSANLTFDGTTLTANTIVASGTVKSSSGGVIFPDNTTQTTAVALPSGSMTMYAASTAPTGWLECNGSAISRTTYAALFAAIGTTFGSGNGSTTFNIPDMRGQFARGWDHGAGVDPGRTLGSSQADAFASHTHTTTLNMSSSTGGGTNNPLAGANTSVTTTWTSAATGGTETRPKNIALMFIIKT